VKLDKVMVCRNARCSRKSCRACLSDWEDHEGKQCKEVEKDPEQALRLK